MELKREAGQAMVESPGQSQEGRTGSALQGALETLQVSPQSCTTGTSGTGYRGETIKS